MGQYCAICLTTRMTRIFEDTPVCYGCYKELHGIPRVLHIPTDDERPIWIRALDLWPTLDYAF